MQKSRLKLTNKRKNYLSDAILLKEKIVCFSIKYHILYFASANFETLSVYCRYNVNCKKSNAILNKVMFAMLFAASNKAIFVYRLLPLRCGKKYFFVLVSFFPGFFLRFFLPLQHYFMFSEIYEKNYTCSVEIRSIQKCKNMIFTYKISVIFKLKSNFFNVWP